VELSPFVFSIPSVCYWIEREHDYLRPAPLWAAVGLQLETLMEELYWQLLHARDVQGGLQINMCGVSILQKGVKKGTKGILELLLKMSISDEPERGNLCLEKPSMGNVTVPKLFLQLGKDFEHDGGFNRDN
jgi:hypothetical protein